jgi:uncharacterized protein (TIGR02246 family)
MRHFVTKRRGRIPAVPLFLTVSAAAILAVGVHGADTKGPTRAKAPDAAAGRDQTGELKPQEAKQLTPSDGEAAIRATAAAFVKAFNAGDAKAVASLWTSDGTVGDSEGSLLKGHKAIEAEYAALFKQHPTARMQVAIKSIEFPTPTTAIEDGIAQVVTRDSAPPSASRYTALHVQENGKWLMASVRESDMPVVSNFPHLQELGWLVGRWETKSGGTTARTQIRWIANKSFIQRDFSVDRDGVLSSSGTQIVGWDPRSEQIVSWTFDSSGGHGTSRWMATPEGWRLASAGVTADGMPTSSIDRLIRVPGDDNVFGWRSADRKLGETKLPDVSEVVFDRAERRAASTSR